MSDQADVRRIALSLPDTSEADGEFAFSVSNKGREKRFVSAWRERVEPKNPKVPRTDVIVVPVADLGEKEALLASDAEKFFTEAHYNGFPSVLVRLPAVETGELTELILDAWRIQASHSLVTAFEDHHPVTGCEEAKRSGPAST